MNKTKEAVFTTAFLAVLLGVASVGYTQTAEKCDPADKDCPKAGKEVAKTEVNETKPQAADADLKAAVSADDPKSVSAESKKPEAILSAPPKPDAADGSAQTQTPQQDAQALAKKLANPVAALISLPFQNNFDFGMGPNEDGFRYTLNVQPVIPITLNKDWNLISRTIVPIIGQTNVVGTSSQFGLGDTIQSFFFSPNKSEPFVWGIGPQFLIPTATNEYLGTQKFAVGGTVLVLKQKGKWTVGSLVGHLWSVAGKDSRADFSTTNIQPFISYTTKTAWTFSLNTESTYEWKSETWNVPIHLQATKLVKFGKQPVSVGGGLRCWATSGPGGPQWCGFRILFTPLFPKK
jgi:hypothetical protein